MAKKLHRSESEKIIGGVCGGIGEYFDLDPVIIRILFLIAFFSAGAGFLAYIIMWIIVPGKDGDHVSEANSNYDNTHNQNNNNTESTNTMRKIFGISLIFIGLLSLIDNVVPMIDLKLVFPVLLLVSGFVILFNGNKAKKTEKEGYEVF